MIQKRRLNERVKQFIMENNKDNKDISKLFNNLGDNFDLKTHYANSTQIQSAMQIIKMNFEILL